MKARACVKSLLAGVSLSLLLTTGALADGKTVFVAKCGSCHRTGGEAAVFAPTKFAGLQWDRFFSRNKHVRYKDISDQVSSYDLEEVKTYLMDHAADSDMPEMIGLQ